MKDEDESPGARVLLDIIILSFHSLWRGFVFMKLWTWFLIPLGLPSLPLAELMGIQLVLTYATFHYTEKLKRAEWFKEWLADWTIRWTLPGVVLLTGWIYTLFM